MSPAYFTAFVTLFVTQYVTSKTMVIVQSGRQPNTLFKIYRSFSSSDSIGLVAWAQPGQYLLPMLVLLCFPVPPIILHCVFI